MLSFSPSCVKKNANSIVQCCGRVVTDSHKCWQIAGGLDISPSSGVVADKEHSEGDVDPRIAFLDLFRYAPGKLQLFFKSLSVKPEDICRDTDDDYDCST